MLPQNCEIPLNLKDVAQPPPLLEGLFAYPPFVCPTRQPSFSWLP